MGQALVVQALDAQLQPLREAAADLGEAQKEIAALREDVAQLEREGAALSREVISQADKIGELQARLAGRRVQSRAAADAGAGYAGGVAFLTVMGAAALLFVAARHVWLWVFG